MIGETWEQGDYFGDNTILPLVTWWRLVIGLWFWSGCQRNIFFFNKQNFSKITFQKNNFTSKWLFYCFCYFMFSKYLSRFCQSVWKYNLFIISISSHIINLVSIKSLVGRLSLTMLKVDLSFNSCMHNVNVLFFLHKVAKSPFNLKLHSKSPFSYI